MLLSWELAMMELFYWSFDPKIINDGFDGGDSNCEDCSITY